MADGHVLPHILDHLACPHRSVVAVLLNPKVSYWYTDGSSAEGAGV